MARKNKKGRGWHGDFWIVILSGRQSAGHARAAQGKQVPWANQTAKQQLKDDEHMKDVMEKMEEIEQDSEELRQEYEDEDGEDSEEEDGEGVPETIEVLERPDEEEYIEPGDGVRESYEIEWIEGEDDGEKAVINRAGTIQKADTLENAAAYDPENVERTRVKIHLPDEKTFPENIEIDGSLYPMRYICDIFEDGMNKRLRHLNSESKLLTKHTGKTLKAEAAVNQDDDYPAYLKPDGAENWYAIAPVITG